MIRTNTPFRLLARSLVVAASIASLSSVLAAGSAISPAKAMANKPEAQDSKSPGAIARDRSAVTFPVQCTPEAAAAIEDGIYQMHHMMYLVARDLFRQASAAEPDCALAYWGEAMTYIHPLWPDRPSPEILSIGSALSARAAFLGGRTEREAGYIETAQSYFLGGDKLSEAERLVKFEAAWKTLQRDNPDDQEASAFYALAKLATVDRSDKTYAQRRVAGARAEAVLAAAANHPGAQHYIIHAYDVPGLAVRALPVARQYGVTAPRVPHATHMMSHIFTRLGLWDESIEWNEISAAAALKVGESQGAISLHYLHALDYLTYARLQKGQEDEARAIVDTMANLKGPYGTLNRFAHAYAFAATPARYALERKDWERAASLGVRQPDSFPWEPTHTPYVAITHFARGLGLANLGRFAEAEAEARTLSDIHQETVTYSAYWATQVEIQLMSLQAWSMFLSSDEAGGLTRMKAAAALEATAEKSPVTPGEVLPAAELLGDMLMRLGRHEEAIAAWRTVLVRSPGRRNALLGTASALEASGKSEDARAYTDEANK